MNALLVALVVSAVPQPVSLPFPGSGDAWTDYVVFDAASQKVWVPAGSRGQVYGLDVKSRSYVTVEGFPTAQNGKRVAGPSSVAAGPTALYVGNRADSKVCAVDRTSLKIGNCIALPSSPDGVAYVAATNEVWVTTPHQKTVTVLSTKGGTLAVSATIPIDGSPEGYAVDEARGLFFTNDEEGDRTYAIDVHSHKITGTYHPNCGGKGPRGLAFEPKQRLLVVACFDGAAVLDLAKDGTVTSRLKTGEGVDNIDYWPAQRAVYLASGKAAKLAVAKLSETGALTQTSEVPTSEGIRVVVVDGKGTAYLPDSKGARLLVVPSP